MSDSEEEFASADEGQGDTGKGGVGSGKATEVVKATSKDESKKSGGNTVKSLPIGDCVDKERSKEKTKTPSSSAKPEEKPSAKAKGKHSKQKRKQGNKKEAGSGTLGTTASASVIANTETKSVAVVKDNTEVGQQKPSDSQTPEPSSEDTLKNTDDQTNVSSTEPADQTGTTESPDPVNANTSGKVEELSSNVSVKEQTIDRGGSGSQNVELEDKDPVPGPDTGQEKTSSGWGGWSSWGSSLVTAATSSVSTFTNQVGEGFTTVLETVETTLGAPLPEQLAKSDQETTEKLTGQEKRMEESDGEGKTAEGEKGVEIAKDDRISAPTKEDSASGSGQGADGGWLSGWGVSNITHLVSDTGKTLVTGGLDVLESIGKKTYDALSEHDPGLKAVMKGDNKPNLSSMLREAKQQADERSRQEEEYEQSRQAHFGAMFDEYQGLVNLEALEMLSNQSETKVQSLLAGVQSEEREQLKKDLVKIKEAFELEELEDDDDDIEHDFSKLITDHLSEFHRGTSPAKLNAVQAKIRGWLSNFYSEAEGTTTDPKEIHKVCIQSLAELTAKTVEQYHKAGELLLLQTDGGRDMLTRASALASVTRVVCTEVGILSTKFTKCLNKVAEDVENTDSINTYITNVYLEASNSSTYIQDAFQLLLPVLQQASVQEGQAKS